MSLPPVCGVCYKLLPQIIIPDDNAHFCSKYGVDSTEVTFTGAKEDDPYKLEEKFYRYGIKPEWLQVHRVFNDEWVFVGLHFCS